MSEQAEPDSAPDSAPVSASGVLTAQVTSPTLPRLAPGLYFPSGEEGDKVPLFFVPDDLPDGPLPLVVLLHGGNGASRRTLPILRGEAQRRKFLVALPKSVGQTWDALGSGFGPDVEGIDDLLRWVFERFEVDPRRIVVAGISDGASYAISLGLINGEFFSAIIAFSAGFFVPGRQVGKPAIFVSHGIYDDVLPIEFTGREVVRLLIEDGYTVDYREFEGYHEAPYDIAEEAADYIAPRIEEQPGGH
jgi:predicted esterase